MRKHVKDKILSIDNDIPLSNLNVRELIYGAKLAKFIKPKYVIGFQVRYKDRSKKKFNIEHWMIFRNGILNNLYYKGFCKIKILSSTKKHVINSDISENALKVIEKLSEMSNKIKI